MKKWNYKALELLLLDYETGFTVKQIAQDLGHTERYILKLLKRAKKIAPDRPNAYSLQNLSAFSRIRLTRAGLDSSDKIKAAIENGSLDKVIPFQGNRDEVKNWIRRLYEI